jgi:thymidylate synthase (FAD)
MRIIEPSVELLWITPKAAMNVELATRTCYKSEDSYDPAKTAAFLDKIVNQYHHESVIEHGVASFRVITDRGITHEIVRHRIASYSQESTRYVNYAKDKHGGGDIQFILPLGLTQEQEAFVRHAYTVEQNLYLHAIAIGLTPQQARDVLPNGVKTEIVMTLNFRSWLNFFKLRTAKGAHPKMQVVAKMLQAILRKEVPEIFGQPQSSTGGDNV